MPHNLELDNWRRLVTHVLAGMPHLTLAKLLNLIRCEMEKWRRVVRPRAYPYMAVIDTGNTCNLRCPYCPTGATHKSGRAERMIDTLLVKKLLDELDKYLIMVDLYNWGEPLLHPQIVEIVRMIHNRRIFVKISTNLNTYNKETLLELCEAGLDYLMVSLSGASQEVYEQYHRRGNLAVVLENIRYLTAFKRRNNLRRPIIELHYLLFKHNRHEMKAARTMAAGLGVDLFKRHAGTGPEEAIIDASNSAKNSLAHKFFNQLWHLLVLNSDSRKVCRDLWNILVLNCDGSITPCTCLFFKRDDFGEYAQDQVMQIRNNPLFVTARKLFNSSEVMDLPRTMQHPCLKCIRVHNQPHMHEYHPE